MNPLAIALQGIGFGPRATAVQGFVELEVRPEDQIEFTRLRPSRRLKKKKEVEKVRRDTDDDVLFAILF